MRKRTGTIRRLFLMALLIQATGGALSAPITVTVNGNAVDFTGTPPTEIKGAVLVPLRGVFEALGASVNYNPVTRVINAQKGTAAVRLQIGSTSATVNGQPQTLSQPAQEIGGTTLVPLRFVAQALGAYVEWHAVSSTVEIKTAEPHLATLPAPPGAGAVTGQVTGVYTDTSPQQITLRVNGQNTSVPIASSTIILRSVTGQPATEVPLGQITPGDQVMVQRGPDGAAQSVTASFGEVRGTVKSIGKLADGDPVITLNDGTTVELVPDAPVRMGGRKILLTDIMPDEEVIIRTNPANSLGYGVALVTGSNPNPNPPGQTPTVTSFTQDAARPLRAGETLTATLRGTPGGQASFAIPGVTSDVPMKETAPGVYVGSFTVPKNVSVSGATVLGKLSLGGIPAPLIQANGTVTIASTPPKITDISPSRGATVESALPLIYATLADTGGMGIDPTATQISLDGADQTAQAAVTPAFVSLKPAQPLAAGTHTVRLAIADKAGNVTTEEWPFKVSTGDLVQSFTTTAPAGQELAAGTKVVFTLAARPGGKAGVDLGAIAKDVPLTETEPGIYKGSYTVPAGENARDVPVTARFVAKDGTVITKSLAQGLTIAGGPPGVPIITAPGDNTTVGETLTVKGTATPGATVRVSIDYVSKALGLIAINGSVGTKEVTADKNGNWTAEGFTLRASSLFSTNKDTVFTISAVTVDANGDASPATTVQVQRG